MCGRWAALAKREGPLRGGVRQSGIDPEKALEFGSQFDELGRVLRMKIDRTKGQNSFSSR